MIEKDNIQELFSKAFENHASAVKPELWTGVQAKMAAAGMVGGTAAVKGISALTKWIIGTAAVTTIGVTTYLVVDNNTPAEKPANSTATITKPSASENPTDETKTVALKQNNGTTIVNPNTNGNERLQNDVGHGFSVDDPILHPIDWNNVEIWEPELQDVSAGQVTPPNKTPETTTNPESSPSISKTPANPKETTIREPETTKPEVKEAKVEVPNVFTPNFDRNNDYFELISEENVSKVEITIFDPNGRKVFISNDKNFKWDGNNMSGEACGQGIYSYQLVYFDLNGKANLKGDYIYLQR